MNDQLSRRSRRWFVKAGAIASAAFGLGTTGSVGAQNSSNETGTGTETDQGQLREAYTTGETFFSGTVFRVVSPPLENAPPVGNPESLQNYSVRVIEFFNTNEEGYLFVPQNTQIEEGQKYVFDQWEAPIREEIDTSELVRVQYRPLGDADLPFDLEVEEDFEVLDDTGGEAAVRPDNFFGSAPFTITSGPQGWVPPDVEQSGLFTDYNTVHAEYFGTNEQFLFFVQEGAETQEGRLYIMRDESEVFDPAGNLVAAEFNAIDEDSFTIERDDLR
ncbi:hypothetical protein [Halopiger thermotolerans]